VRSLAVIIAVFGIAFAVFVSAMPLLPDADSYFHLAVAREYAQHGLTEGLRWARFSVMHEHFGDKELLFHVALIPFSSSETGGRVALMLANLAIVALIGAIGVEMCGPVGALIPAALYLCAPSFVSRVFRLRPELGALMLVLGFVYLAARRRDKTAGAIALVFSLSYTAVHLLPIVALAARRWRLALATTAGAALGLLLHPHFPDNVRIWYLQNVSFFRLAPLLDRGTEIGRPSLGEIFIMNAGWWLVVCACLVVAWRDREAPRDFDRRVLISALVVFTLLQIAFARMSTYFFPVAMLVVLSMVPVRRAGIVAAAIAIGALLSLPGSRAVIDRLLLEPGPRHPWAMDAGAMARTIPPGARVAAHWGMAEFYVWYAPQAEYLNLLDPVFMYAAHPREYAIQRALFDGKVDDVPAALAALQSDYIAFDRLQNHTALADRVWNDPRLRTVFAGYNYVGAVRPQQRR
jgi:hypothetical protein